MDVAATVLDNDTQLSEQNAAPEPAWSSLNDTIRAILQRGTGWNSSVLMEWKPRHDSDALLSNSLSLHDIHRMDNSLQSLEVGQPICSPHWNSSTTYEGYSSCYTTTARPYRLRKTRMTLIEREEAFLQKRRDQKQHLDTWNRHLIALYGEAGAADLQQFQSMKLYPRKKIRKVRKSEIQEVAALAELN